MRHDFAKESNPTTPQQKYVIKQMLLDKVPPKRRALVENIKPLPQKLAEELAESFNRTYSGYMHWAVPASAQAQAGPKASPEPSDRMPGVAKPERVINLPSEVERKRNTVEWREPAWVGILGLIGLLASAILFITLGLIVYMRGWAG